MSLLPLVASATNLLPAAEGDPIGPSDVFAGFADSALAIVPWIAAGIAAAIGVYFAVIGIKKGLAWFFKIVNRA